MKKIIIFSCCLFLFASCDKKEPISDEKLVNEARLNKIFDDYRDQSKDIIEDIAATSNVGGESAYSEIDIENIKKLAKASEPILDYLEYSHENMDIGDKAIAGLMLYCFEREEEISKGEFWGYTNGSRGSIYSCALEALGVDALYDFWLNGRFNLSTYAGKKAAIKAVGKVATRFLGVAGAAWAAIQFGACLATI